MVAVIGCVAFYADVAGEDGCVCSHSSLGKQSFAACEAAVDAYAFPEGERCGAVADCLATAFVRVVGACCDPDLVAGDGEREGVLEVLRSGLPGAVRTGAGGGGDARIDVKAGRREGGCGGAEREEEGGGENSTEFHKNGAI